MDKFYSSLHELSAKTTSQSAMDLGILAGFLCSIENPNFESSKKAACSALLRLAKELVVENSDKDIVDLDDAMDAEEDAAAANGQIL